MYLLAHVFHYENTHPEVPGLHFGPISVHWYGVAYLTGFLIAYFVLIKLARGRVMRMPVEWISDLVGFLALGVIAGGRLGWWIFYHNSEGRPEPWWQIFAIWQGGMSFHGGLTGVVLILFFWCRYKKVSFLNLADCMALVTPIGLCLGRIANFINGELYGRPTDVWWAVVFPYKNDPLQLPRHPSQLYEAFLEGPVLLGVVWLFKSWRNRHEGQIAAAFVIFYGVFRFAVEFTREPDMPYPGYFLKDYKYLGWVTMGQLLSFIIFAIGVVWFYILQSKAPKTADIQELSQRAFEVVPTKEKKSQKPAQKKKKN